MSRAVFCSLIFVYRKLISPFLPLACRFYPSCSVYTEQAIQRYGIIKGVAYGINRIVRCHPWHPGGYDPVK
ncbi:MAG TPA: membrane protein insertion efficiency factor YidD [Phototrophicaceae bacterium]|jgi:putative membrane protein insertion efficiency factor|nr:membrane protein insertion efficiency factor YidD [Phototrophicaceae bacterium]